jgi:hypothetical protein
MTSCGSRTGHAISQQDRNYERSRGIWTNLFGGSKKNSESRKVAGALTLSERPRFLWERCPTATWDWLPVWLKEVRALRGFVLFDSGRRPAFKTNGGNFCDDDPVDLLPGVRNHAGGHGEEPAAPPVPDYIAGYALHLSAANIVMAVAAFKKLPTI